ncbi:MAG: biotin-dependent carboxyltransferase family protein [Isosphaeraceae bacterium]|nr:biotin-dependent carboxyltransferase family protein [Isosphaeraceae bacterium]
MGLTVVHPGTFSTLQDLGRVGYRAWGVPVGGAFDTASALLANALVGNSADCAVVELTLLGGTYEARQPLALALAGAPMQAEIVIAEVVRSLDVPCSFTLRSGERLVLGSAAQGVRTYLAVKGGWQTPPLLGSRSQENRLKAGQVLPALSATSRFRRLASSPVLPPRSNLLRIVEGPDAARVSDPSFWDEFEFVVAPECDRMGVRLISPPLPVVADDARLSSPVAQGGIQVAGGQAIVLGVACGTMGGYPLVGHVISSDLDRLGQVRPGELLRFRRVGLDVARGLDREARRARHESWRRITALVADGGIELA